MRTRSTLRNSIEYWIARGVVFTLEYSPLPLARGLSRAYALALDVVIPRLRRIAMRNLGLVFPDRTPEEHRKIVDGVYRSIARLLLAFARLPHIRTAEVAAKWIRYEGAEHVEAARKRGRGILFATGHLGNWELSAFAYGLFTGPMNVVVRPLDNPRIDALVAERRALSGNRVIGKKDFARGILAALHRNEAVGILIDQNSSLEEGTFVDFLGVPACAGTGFARIAAHSGAAVIPGFALWSDAERKYVLRFSPPVEVLGDPVADTKKIQQVLASVIREYPDQWLWIHRRWKTRPPGQPPLY